jgi:type I restriction enzyme S subunit
MSLTQHAETKPAIAPWIDVIPTHWDEKPFYAVARERKVKNKGMKEDNLLSLSYGNIIRKDINTPTGLLPDSFETYQIVEANDVIFRLTDLQNDKRSLRSAICSERGIITSAYLAAQTEGFQPAFMSYLMRSYDVQKVFYSMGGGMRQSLGYEDIRRMPVVVPPIEEQTAIANFLDRETTQIDGLIKKKERFIALLKEKRAAVITHAVTKGVDPGVAMKDSGQDWLGQVPEHWQAVPPTSLFTESKQRAQEGDQMLSATQKYGVIPLAEFEELEQRQVTMAVVNLDKRKHTEIGDFVISMRSMDGGLERARAVGSVRSSYSVLKCGPEVEGRFFGYLLKSSLYIQALRLTTSFIRDGQDMNFSHFRKVRLPRIPVVEQARIADHIDTETQRIDGLIAKTTHSIDLLKEKRSALITAAVTGKIDVRNAA